MSRPLPTQIGADPGADHRADCISNLLGLIRLGCLGGQVGHPVGFVFRDFTADVVCSLWALVARSFNPEEVVEVWTQADIQKLRQRLTKLRVIFILKSHRTKASFANILAWLIEQRRGCSEQLPVVMTIYDESIEEGPGTTILIAGNPEISCAAGKWLYTNGRESWPAIAPAAPPALPDTRSLLNAIMDASTKANRSLSPADMRLVDALLHGQFVGQFVETEEEPVNIDVSHYEGVRQLLQNPLLQQPTATADDLTLLMISRANAYLRARARSPVAPVAPLGARRGDLSTTEVFNDKESSNRPSTITVVELANLGNVRSTEFQTVLSADNGNATALEDIGIRLTETANASGIGARAPPPSQTTRTVNLTKTTTWSFKQARTRFEQLRKSKLIEARRKAANSPYEYVLPDELRQAHAPFAHLPAAEDVRLALDHHPESSRPC